MSNQGADSANDKLTRWQKRMDRSIRNQQILEIRRKECRANGLQMNDRSTHLSINNQPEEMDTSEVSHGFTFCHVVGKDLPLQLYSYQDVSVEEMRFEAYQRQAQGFRWPHIGPGCSSQNIDSNQQIPSFVGAFGGFGAQQIPSACPSLVGASTHYAGTQNNQPATNLSSTAKQLSAQQTATVRDREGILQTDAPSRRILKARRKLQCNARRTVTARDVAERMDRSIAWTVLGMGVPRSRVEQAVRKRLSENGEDFTSVRALLEAVFDLNTGSGHSGEDELGVTGNTSPEMLDRFIAGAFSTREIDGDCRGLSVSNSSTNSEVSSRDSHQTEHGRDVAARMDSKTVRAVLRLGVPEREVKKAIRQRLAQNGPDFTSTTALLNAIHSANSASYVDKYGNRPFELQTSKTTPDGRAGKKSKTSESPCSVSSHSDSTQIMEEMAKLKERNRCKICLNKDVCVAFRPCGHLVSCGDCAPRLKTCPICRAKIEGKLRTYMS